MSGHANPPGNQGDPIDLDIQDMDIQDIDIQDMDILSDGQLERALDLSDSEDGGMQIDNDSFPLSRTGMIQVQQVIPEPTRNENLSTIAPGPNAYYQHNNASTQTLTGPPERIRPKARSPMSEEEHAALTVLNDDELLMSYAVNSGHTIPQVRRRFQAKLLAGGDVDLEEELYAQRFIVPESKAHLVPNLINHPDATEAMGLNNTKAWLVPASWKMVVDDDDSGWVAPGSKLKRNQRGQRAVEGCGVVKGYRSTSVSTSGDRMSGSE